MEQKNWPCQDCPNRQLCTLYTVCYSWREWFDKQWQGVQQAAMEGENKDDI